MNKKDKILKKLKSRNDPKYSDKDREIIAEGLANHENQKFAEKFLEAILNKGKGV